jgi:hypothetical protein
VSIFYFDVASDLLARLFSSSPTRGHFLPLPASGPNLPRDSSVPHREFGHFRVSSCWEKEQHAGIPDKVGILQRDPLNTSLSICHGKWTCLRFTRSIGPALHRNETKMIPETPPKLLFQTFFSIFVIFYTDIAIQSCGLFDTEESRGQMGLSWRINILTVFCLTCRI